MKIVFNALTSKFDMVNDAGVAPINPSVVGNLVSFADTVGGQKDSGIAGADVVTTAQTGVVTPAMLAPASAAGAILTSGATPFAYAESVFALSGTAGATYVYPTTSQTLAGLAVAGQTFTAAQKINVNSATAYVVEQDGVKDNVLVVDT